VVEAPGQALVVPEVVAEAAALAVLDLEVREEPEAAQDPELAEELEVLEGKVCRRENG
jgi:hypothetical protein